MKTAKKGWCKFAARGLLCLSLMMLPLLVAGAYANMADDTAGQPLAKQENSPQAYVWFLYQPSPGPFKKGHAALLVFDGTKCYYYSYGPGPDLNPPDENLGFPGDNMFAKVFDTVEEAKAYITRPQSQRDKGDVLSDYKYFIRWKISEEQAKKIKAVPPSVAWTGMHWDLYSNNCWHMVYTSIASALEAACIQNYWPPSPKRNYEKNLNNPHDKDGPIGNMDQ